MSAPERTYHLALRELHAALGATFERRGEWSVPVMYTSVDEEHQALRGAAVFADRSHRSRVMVTGTDANEVLAAVFGQHARELEEGRAIRAAVLDAPGRISDLALVARTGGIAYLVSGEPGRRHATLAALTAAAGPDWDVRIDDRTEAICSITVAGPAAEEAVREHLADALPARLQSLHAATFEFHGFRALAVRTSDTGEDGFEFVLAPAVAHHVAETLAQAGVRPAGFDALDVARIEACIPAFEPDLEPGLTPAQADLDVLLGVPGGAEGVILAAILLDGTTLPSPATPISEGGRIVGQIRSTGWSSALRSVVALGIVETGVALPGTALDAAGIPGTIVAKPFYRRRT